MPNRGSIRNILPPTLGSLQQDISELRREVAFVRTARSAQATQIASGGIAVTDAGSIAVNPGGTSVELRVTDDYGIGHEAGVVEFGSGSAVARPAYMQNVDTGPGSTLVAASIPDGAGGYSQLSMGGASAVLTNARGLASETAVSLLHSTAQAHFKLGSSDTADLLPGVLDVNGDRWVATATEWRAQDSSGTYIPVRASSFPTSSSRAVKEAIVDIPFDSLQAIVGAKAQQWRYLPEYAKEDVAHIGPMAEDLPDAMVQVVDGVKSIDLLSLVGVLWDAVGTLAARVEELGGDGHAA